MIFIDYIAAPDSTLDFEYYGSLTKSETQGGAGLTGASLEWEYNPELAPKARRLQAGSYDKRVAFGYDADELLTCVQPDTVSGANCDPAQPDALTVNYDANGANGLLAGSSIGLITDEYQYNQYGELASYTARFDGQIIFQETVDTASDPRDGLGRILHKAEIRHNQPDLDMTYTYDEQGRLEKVYEGSTLLNDYTYDDNGNLIDLGDGTLISYDEQDRLTDYTEDAQIEYTDDGRLQRVIYLGLRVDYTYDVLGNLKRVQVPFGHDIEYLVDGYGRRVGKKLDGTLAQQLVYKDGLNPVAELDGQGNVVSEFFYGTRANVPDLMYKNGQLYRIISDHLGSPRLVINVNNDTDIPFQADYSVWGDMTVLTGDAHAIPFGFAGGLADPDGNPMVRFGARDYYPGVARWMNKDRTRSRDGRRPDHDRTQSQAARASGADRCLVGNKEGDWQPESCASQA